MKAIIMAGGEGSRLRPLTCTAPKPMAPILNRPVMEHIIRLLRKHGIREIGVTLRVNPEKIRSYFGDGSDFGVSLTYFMEETPLGTAGSVKNAGDFLKEDFLVISGDAMTDMDLTAFIDFHKAKKAEATLLLKRMDIPLEYGVVVTDDTGKIVRFLEKPGWSQVFSDTVNTGIYLLKPSVLRLVDKLPSDFSGDVFPRLLRENRALYGFTGTGYWCDIGDLDAYRHCHYDIFENKTEVFSDACRIAEGVYAEEGAVIEPGAFIKGPARIGKNAHIESGARIDGYTSIGEGCIIRSGASVKRSVLLSDVTVSRNAEVRGSILCCRSFIGEGASVFEQSVIGEESKIGQDAVVRPGVKVWPCKAVGQGEILSRSLVWGKAESDELFTENGMEGDYGTLVTPQNALRLGGAVGTQFRGRVGVASDGSGAGTSLIHAVKSGLMAVGSEVFDFGSQPLPITRSGMKVYGLSAAVHASVLQNKATLTVMEEGGAGLSVPSMRKLTGLYHREEFKNAEGSDIVPVTDVHEYKKYYMRQLLRGVGRADGMRVLAAAGSDAGRELLRSLSAAQGFHLTLWQENLSFDDETAMRKFADAVPENGAEIGAVLDPTQSVVRLVDARGRIIDEDMYSALVPLLVLRSFPKARLIVRASAPSAIEKMAEKYGGSVLRVQDSPVVQMHGLTGGEPESEAQFVLYFDGAGALCRILDFLQKEKTTLSALLAEIPSFYMHRRQIPCKKGDRGRVIRILSHLVPEADTTDGVKIQEKDGWVLILPDGTAPACRIIAHADREEYAAELTDLYDAKIRELLKKKE